MRLGRVHNCAAANPRRCRFHNGRVRIAPIARACQYLWMGEGNTESSKNFERNWLPIVVIVAVVVTCVNLLLFCCYLQSSHREASFEIMEGKVQEAMASSYAPENWPCDPPSDLRSSDLCAQWKAADAARDGANWTLLAFVVGTVLNCATGTVVAFTFFETQKSTRAAINAAESANAALHADRAWITPKLKRKIWRGNVNLEGYPGPRWFDYLVPKIVNTGRSPALNVVPKGAVRFIDKSKKVPTFNRNIAHDVGIAIGPNGSIRPALRIFSKQTEVDDFISGKKDVVLYFIIAYRDVYSGDVIRETEFCHRCSCERSVLPDGKCEITVSRRAEGPQNMNT